MSKLADLHHTKSRNTIPSPPDDEEPLCLTPMSPPASMLAMGSVNSIAKQYSGLSDTSGNLGPGLFLIATGITLFSFYGKRMTPATTPSPGRAAHREILS